jgi:hypothetical protein
LILKQALLWLAGWTFLWGTFVIVWRVAVGPPDREIWWGLAAVPVLTLIAGIVAVRRLPSRDRLRALVDRTSRAGGLVMAAAETSVADWQHAMRTPAQLEVQWRGERAWLTFGAGVAFLLVALLVPQSLVSLAGEPPLDITQEALQLAAQLEVLKEEQVVDPQRVDAWKERLKQLKDDASGTSPVKTLEALDHLRNLAQQAAKEAAESAVSKTEKLGAAEGLAEGIRKNEGALDPTIEKEAVETLADLVKKAAAETNLLDKHLDPELLKQLQGLKLSADDLKKLADALKGSKLDLSEMLDKLHGAKLIDADALKKLLEAGKCDTAELLKKLKPCPCRKLDGKCGCPDPKTAGKCKCCDSVGECKCDQCCSMSVKQLVSQCLG